MTFEQLGLAQPILRAVAAEEYTHPTPIQVQAIPHVLAGSDLLGCAQTGTGKTAAFALPILHRLSGPAKAEVSTAGNGHHHHHAREHNGSTRGTAHRARLRALILCPTRELASQIAESFRTYGSNLPLRSTVVFGGVNQNPQVRSLRAGVDILIATPGRLLDLMQQGAVDLRNIEILVLDEADRMLDMGFIPDIRRIVKHVPAKRQTLLFSATMPGDIRALADSILHNPVSVQVSPVASTVDTVSQSVYFVPRNNKPALLAHLLKKGQTKGDVGRTLVFTRTKRGADKLVKHLTVAGIKAEAIHSNKSQNARTRTLQSFKSKKPPVLVATDIASRGIDVDDITHVFNFDMPNVAETYVHRIGRTGRAGASGVAVSFCDHEERGDLKAIERLTRAKIDVQQDSPELCVQHAAGETQRHADSRARGHRTESQPTRSASRAKHHPRTNHPRTTHASHNAHASKHEGQTYGQRGRGRSRKAGRAR